jgi:hypothetical protein
MSICLYCLIEECAELAKECTEVQQRASKALRFGLSESFPGYGNNQERLVAELNDLIGVVEMLRDRGVLPRFFNEVEVAAKKRKVNHFMIYARDDCGTLTDDSASPLTEKLA